MRKDAESHAQEDRQRKELIEARNQADNAAYAAERALKDHGAELPPELKAEVEGKLADVRTMSQAEDVPGISAASERLREAIQRIGAAASEQSGTAEAASGQTPNPQAEPDVVDGEVKE